MSTGVAVTMAAVVIIAIGGFIAFQIVQSSRQQARETDPARLIGAGIGNLVEGIGRAVSS